MSKSSNIRRSIGLLFMFAFCVAFVCADLVVSSASSSVPQNTNSSTTQEDEATRGGMMTSNANSSNTNTGSTRRRRRRRTRVAAAAVATTPDVSGGASMTTSDMSGAQTDLSGSYTGSVNYPEGGLSGPATLTITGTQFTLTPDGGGSPVNGTVTAVTTRGYTGVTMMFGDRSPIPVTQAPPPLPAVSLRARMAGGRVTLKNVPGEKREFSFASAGAGKARSHRSRRTRKMRKTSSATEDQNRGIDTGIKPPTP